MHNPPQGLPVAVYYHDRLRVTLRNYREAAILDVHSAKLNIQPDHRLREIDRGATR